MYVMPVMFTGMMLFLPSGLVLYILVNTVLELSNNSTLIDSSDGRSSRIMKEKSMSVNVGSERSVTFLKSAFEG